MPVNHKKYDLKKLRSDLSMSQQELADLVGVKRSRLSRIENYKERLSYVQVTILTQQLEGFDRYEIGIGTKTSEKAVVSELESKIESLREIIELKNQIINSKQEMITVLQKQLGGSSTVEQPINYSMMSNKGKFVNWSIIDIPSDSYKEVMPGIFDRLLLSKDDFIEDWEDVFKPVVANIDFSKFKVLLNYSNKGTVFKTHYHVEPEIITVISGVFIERLSKKVINENESIRFESLQPHEVENLSDTKLIILLEKS